MEQFIHAAIVFGLLGFDRCVVSVSDCLGYFQYPCVVTAVEWIIVMWHIVGCFPPLTCTVFLLVSRFILTVSTPFTHSHSLSLILFHENNRAPHRTSTVIQLQTCPSCLCTLNSAYLSMFSCHCLIPRLKIFQKFLFVNKGAFFPYKRWLVSGKSCS